MSRLPGSNSLSSRIRDFCRLRLTAVLPPNELRRLARYLTGLADEGRHPPKRVRGYDWSEIADCSGIEYGTILELKEKIRPALDALVRGLNSSGREPVSNSMVSAKRKPPGGPIREGRLSIGLEWGPGIGVQSGPPHSVRR